MPRVDLGEIRSQIELERQWRSSELRLQKNMIASLKNERDKKVARKSLVVMLYSHFEGVCRAILTIYVSELNKAEVCVRDATPALVAASLADAFHALRSPGSKCKIFRNELPDDAKHHLYARNRDFVSSWVALGYRNLRVDPEKVVRTESNLNPRVLRKILYQLGLDPDLVEPWKGTIDRLLQLRNNYAHGMGREGINEQPYNVLESAVWGVVDELVACVSLAVVEEKYLSSPWVEESEIQPFGGPR